MHILDRIARICRKSGPYDEAGKAVVSLLRAEFPHYNWVGVYMLEGDTLVLGPWDGPQATEHIRIPVGQGVCGAAAREGQTVLVDDVDKDPRYLSCFIQTKSEIVVPIFSGGRVIGEIDIDSDRRAAFNATDRVFLEAVAGHLSAAWERGRSAGNGPGFSTLCVQAGEHGSAPVHPAVFPIYQAVTYEFDSMADLEAFQQDTDLDYIYTRWGNPTLDVACRKIAALEGAEGALLFASGMGAISATLLTLLRSGDEVVAARDLYGGTYHLLHDVFPRLGIAVRWLGRDEFRGLESHLGAATKVVYFEPVTNPGLRVLDPRPVAAACRDRGILTVVDNTFATPFNLRPMEHGIDVVVHSGTKYLSGHSDVTCGVVASRMDILRRVRNTQRYLGNTSNPYEANLLSRGLKTFPLRMERHAVSARALADMLAGLPGVRQVRYPGRPDHPDRALASEILRTAGGMVTVEVDGGLDGAKAIVDRLTVARRAASLGSVETLVSIPVLTSHVNISDADLAQAGVTPGMIRISVGMEDVKDLADDFTQAVNGARETGAARLRQGDVPR